MQSARQLPIILARHAEISQLQYSQLQAREIFQGGYLKQDKRLQLSVCLNNHYALARGHLDLSYFLSCCALVGHYRCLFIIQFFLR